MLGLARAVGLDAPDGRVCTWRERPPAVGERRGILVRLFAESEELSLGSVELSAAEPGGYDPDRRGLHTLLRVRSAVEILEVTAKRPMVEPFAMMLAFDAWIGNSDRHQENWGVLRAAGVPVRLAPVFDPAACLGVELDPRHPCLQPESDLSQYIERCPSGFGDGQRDKPLLPMARVVAEVSQWPAWRAGIQAWLAAFAGAMDTFDEVVRHVPHDWLPAERAAFASRLLRARLEWLRRRSGA
jgi:hypothetical protein